MKPYPAHRILQYNESKFKISICLFFQIEYLQKHPSPINGHWEYPIQVFQLTSVYNTEQICRLMLTHYVRKEPIVHE